MMEVLVRRTVVTLLFGMILGASAMAEFTHSASRMEADRQLKLDQAYNDSLVAATADSVSLADSSK